MKVRSRKTGISQMKIFVVFVCVVALLLLVASDVRAATFVKKIKEAGRFSAAIQTIDGSYVSISTLGDSFTSTSCIVRKISSSGKRIWERTLSFEIPRFGFVLMGGIAETLDGYVLVGSGRLGGYYSNYSGVIVKLRPDGTVRWSKTFGESAAARLILFDSVSSTADGGYIVQGRILSPSGTILMKFTSSGSVVWSKSFKELSFATLSQPVSGGLILAHQLESTESTGLRILKVNELGRIVLKETLKIDNFHLHTLGRASSNGVVLAGKSSSSKKLILIALDENGELKWKAGYSLEVPSFDISNLVQTFDGGYVVTGTKYNPDTNGNRGGFVLRVDAKRNLVFQKTFGVSEIEEGAESVFATKDGGFTVFGSSGLNDMLVLSLNSDGVVPGCRFLHRLNATRVGSPSVVREALDLGGKDFLLPTAGTIQIRSVVSEKRSSDACL